MTPPLPIISQPVTLRFRNGSKTRRYTPDFLVRGSNGRSRLIEVKYRAELQLRWDQYRLPFAAARDWAREQGAIFRIATERHIRDAALDNAKRLLPLRRAPCDSDAAALLLAVIRDQKVLTFEPRRHKVPKLVHKILFSMPRGTPPDKLLAAVRNFAQQEFADRHRYAWRCTPTTPILMSTWS